MRISPILEAFSWGPLVLIARFPMLVQASFRSRIRIREPILCTKLDSILCGQQ